MYENHLGLNCITLFKQDVGMQENLVISHIQVEDPISGLIALIAVLGEGSLGEGSLGGRIDPHDLPSAEVTPYMVV